MKKFWLSMVLMLLSVSVRAQFVGIWKNGDPETFACQQWVENRLRCMSLKEKIGQLFIHTIAPVQNGANLKNLEHAVRLYKVGGLLFSGGQLPDQIALTNRAQEWSDTPLLITFDGEWGLSMRLKNTPSFPRNRVLGCIQDNDLLFEYGQEVARQCREIGVHVNFAPVADIDNNPANPVINTRSFGADRENVSQKVIHYSLGLQEGKVISVAKHFPGHGDTKVDSHKALPILNFTRERLDSLELYPFRQYVEAGLSGVMVGHLELPCIDQKPASLSSKIISILKDDLDFKGLVFTDALEMKGVSKHPHVSAKALMAGCDMLLVPRNLKREFDGVLQAVRSGELTEKEINEKCRKVLTYKYLLGLTNRPHVQLSGLEKRLNRPETRALQDKLGKAAVTVVTNQGGLLPLDTVCKGTAVLQIGQSKEGNLLMQHLCKKMDVDCFTAIPGKVTALLNQLRRYKRVIVTFYTEKDAPYRPLLRTLSTDKQLIYLYFTPLRHMSTKGKSWEKAGAVILAHSDRPAVQHFVGDVLIGKEQATGKLSVGAGSGFSAGTGVTLPLKETKVYRPEDYGMNPKVLNKIDLIAEEGIRAKAYPGCQIVILKNGVTMYDKCFGHFTYESSPKVTPDAVYDLASLTKASATVLAVMKLYDEGRFGLTDPIGKYVPALKGSDKEKITIEDLLLHQSGLPSSYPFYCEAIDSSSYQAPFYRSRLDANHHFRIDRRLYAVDTFRYKEEWVTDSPVSAQVLPMTENLYVNPAFKDYMLQLIATKVKRYSRRYRYSCLNFMLLKEMVENLSGMPMDKYLANSFYEPMGLTHTLYCPLSHFEKKQIVPTVRKDYLRNRKPLQGYVHDEIASFLGGVSGNAGLFGTAREVAQIFQLLLDKGIYKGKRYLQTETCELFQTHTSRISRRGLGFDKPDKRRPALSPCALEAPAQVFGHTGFTGTCAWADPKNQLVFVFISNRIYPRPFDHKALMKLNIRPRIQQVMYQALK